MMPVAPSMRISLCMVIAAVIACAPGNQCQAQSLWELKPYRVHVLLAMDNAPELSSRRAADVGREILDRSEAVIGPAWTVTVAIAPATLRGRIVREIDRVTWDDLAPLATDGTPDDHWDKIMLVAVVAEVDAYRIKVREMDVRTRRWGAVVKQVSQQITRIPNDAFRAVASAFAPLAQIETTLGAVSTLRLRAGALSIRDPDLAMLTRGDVLQPIIRRDDRQGLPLAKRGIEPIDWTYLVTEKVVGSTALCRVYSGWRGPLAGRVRGRTKRYALAVKPVAGVTRLQLVSRDKSHRRLAGYDIYATRPRHLLDLLTTYGLLDQDQVRVLEEHRRSDLHLMIGYLATAEALITAEQFKEAAEQLEEGADLGELLIELAMITEKDKVRLARQLAQHPEEELIYLAIVGGMLDREQLDMVRSRRQATELVGRTDHNGVLSIPAANFPLQVLYVKHGGALLARLPMVPGLKPNLEAEIMDDDRRLAAEGFITALQENLVDLVVLREILITRFHIRLESGKQKDLEPARQRLDELESLYERLDIFRDELTTRRKEVEKAAGDGWDKAKVLKLYDDTDTILVNYLDPTVPKNLRKQLADRR